MLKLKWRYLYVILSMILAYGNFHNIPFTVIEGVWAYILFMVVRAIGIKMGFKTNRPLPEHETMSQIREREEQERINNRRHLN